MANIQHQAIAKLELDCSEAVSVSLTDGGLWVVVEIEKDSQCFCAHSFPVLVWIRTVCQFCGVVYSSQL